MSPVLYIQPFPTCCLTCNRRQSDHRLWRQIQQRKWDTNQHKTQTGDWQWRKADMQSHGWGIQPTTPEPYTAPSTQVLPYNHFHRNQPMSSKSSTRNNLSSYLGSSSPYRKLLSAQQSSLCAGIEDPYPWTDVLFQTQSLLKIYKSCSSPLTYPECPEALYSLQLCCWHWCSCWQSWSFLLSRNVDICEKKS